MNHGEDSDGPRTWEEVQSQEESVLPPRTGLPPGSPRVGLAFSGGGIRSATFNLGILQALAKHGVLPCIDYLSTVSGGGYIGGCLLAWIKRTPGGAPNVYAQLANSANQPVAWLRRFSNYLTPRVGLLSTDSLTFALTYVRNVTLNLLILVSLLAGLMLVPRILVHVAGKATAAAVPGLVAGAALLLVLVAAFTGWNLAQPGRTSQRWIESAQGVFLLVVLPLMAASSLLTVALWGTGKAWNAYPRVVWAEWGSVAYFLLSAIMVGVYWWSDPDSLHTSLSRRYWGAIALVSSLVVGALGGVALRATAHLFSVWASLLDPGKWLFVGWGAPLVGLTFAALVGFHIGLMGNSFSDELREWLTRAAALALGVFVILAAIFAITVYGPWLFMWSKSWVAEVGWPALIWIGLRAGKKLGHKNNPGIVIRILAKITPALFLLGLCVLLSRIVWWAAPWLLWSVHVEAPHRASYWVDLSQTAGLASPGSPLQAICIAAVALFVLAAILSWRIDLNEFSMQMLYRNRLVRCYLGASRQSRAPQPFTGFDPGDDILLHDFCPKSGYSGPFPIFNATLNEIDATNLAWQKRKGRSFTFTPLHSGCGSGAYRPTGEYGYPGGVYLGTAMGISGAAVNPGLGPKTRPDLEALMTIFDLRLGWWMGNPKLGSKTWPKSSPPFGLPYLLRELFGATTGNSAYVNLSDGGNFENLGIYELVRRRCRVIIACDADMDGALTCEDLANAIRKCRIDFQADINIDVTHIRERKSYWAQGKIVYPGKQPAGTLIYLKASVLAAGGKEPTDVLAYKTRCPAFPHESTADQWFNEDQFESYRRLGQHVAETAYREDAFAALNEYMASAAAAPGHSGHGSAAAQSPTGAH